MRNKKLSILEKIVSQIEHEQPLNSRLRDHILITDDFWVLKAPVIARSEATKQSRSAVNKPGLLRRFAPRNNEVAIKALKNDS